MGLFRESSKEQKADPPQFPHCDARVLHAPEDGCKYCNEHVEWQYLRDAWQMNFTGKREPGKILCPSEHARSLSEIEKWHGNKIAAEAYEAAHQFPTADEVDQAIEDLITLKESLDEIQN